MRNNQIRVVDLATELHVHPADVQHALGVMKLPERQSILGLISGQHAEMLRAGLRNGNWRRRSRESKLPVQPRLPRTRTYYPLCSCCALKFQVVLPASEIGPDRVICSICADHPLEPGESGAQKIGRLEDHLKRTKSWAAALTVKLNEMQQEKDDAYRKRNVWRETLVRVIMAHALDEESGGAVCTCGEPYPCITRRVLTSTNRGVSQSVDEFEAMPAAKRDKLLAGEKWTFSDELTYQSSLDEDGESFVGEIL